MSENINLALQLLLVGMVTVFFILGIVVGIGKLLIFSVNKFSPAPAVVPKRAVRRNSNTVPSEHVAVLASVIDLVTENKGTLKSIKKIS